MESPETSALLQDAGLRDTEARRAILETIHYGDHLDAETIARRAGEHAGRVSIQAVYETLHALHRAHVIRKVEPARGPARFETRVGDNHHHLVCRRCGQMADADCISPVAPCLRPVDPAGYAIDQADVIYWGFCPACRIDQ